jgi:hypothetical protein
VVLKGDAGSHPAVVSRSALLLAMSIYLVGALKIVAD